MQPTVKFKKMYPDAMLPAYETAGSAGADIRAYYPDAYPYIDPGKQIMVATGLKVEVPEGYEIQVRPRSGIAAKHMISVTNSPGTIDSDYRGEIKVMLINHGPAPFGVFHGMRIAQIVVAPVVRSRFEEVDELSETERGEGGFGSTGVK